MEMLVTAGADILMPVMVDGVGTAMDYAYDSFNQVKSQMLHLLDFVVVVARSAVSLTNMQTASTAWYFAII